MFLHLACRSQSDFYSDKLSFKRQKYLLTQTKTYKRFYSNFNLTKKNSRIVICENLEIK
jgi:hypothetical protein